MSAGRALGNQVCDLGVSGFGLIKPCHQSIVAFLVLGLIEGNVSVLLDAILDELGGDVTGDGYVDAFDLALAGEYINTFTEPEAVAFMNAADLFEDGYLDATDLAYLIYIANFEE